MNAIEVNALSYRYADGTEALREISFSVAEGERVGLIGPNGAGKSTLLLHLNGLLPERPAAQPAIRVLDMPVTDPHLLEIRAKVGLLFQDPDDQLFCPTVREDVAFGPQQLGVQEPALTSRVSQALEQVGLRGYEERLPHHLSRGERRRVCLAGLLACDARLLALDEPTSDLDPRGRRELKALLQRLPVAQIIATHDLELVVEICPRVLVLDHGAIVAQGPTETLLNDEALMLAHGLERPHILRHHHPH
ncbi:MAG: cobalt ABC transporter ATP-binding protein [Lentisphaerae bacterium RIFOXYB12_FULL_65_16]|nr:MAG: cobalt ABC transporter ATP-binding protein [Lentisphaerae bacterium RIFOXYA12_64_32]OGV92458.1 MAG: cobalt ABC transporter ATP-binding protein [Lentisphaerae bacterium RIFOXYB12_FULL_65_16]